jgi:hypothetical protein
VEPGSTGVPQRGRRLVEAMLTRLARWWLARKERRAPGPPPYVLRGECCAPGCGVALVDGQVHLVGARSTDDERLGIDTGGTAMSADFCAEHCPGGCQHGCVASVV